MILELAIFTVRLGQQQAFEAAFDKAQRLLCGLEGYLSHELHCSVEREHHYALLIEWRAIEDRTLGFVRTQQFVRWRELLQPHLTETAQVEYFRTVTLGCGAGPHLPD